MVGTPSLFTYFPTLRASSGVGLGSLLDLSRERNLPKTSVVPARESILALP